MGWSVEGPPHFVFAFAVACSLVCHSPRRAVILAQPESPYSPLPPPLFVLAVILSASFEREEPVLSVVEGTPIPLAPPQPSVPFSPQTPAHCSSPIAHSRNKKIAVAYPQKPQQIRLSSPSTPKNPTSSHSINHFPPKNSWHSSYAPLDTINIWIKSIEGQL